MKNFLKEWGLLLFNAFAFSAFMTLLLMDATSNESIYKDRRNLVLEKKLTQGLASKGRVYDRPYLRVQRGKEKLWVESYMEEWLNLEVGESFNDRVPRNEVLLYWLRALIAVSGLAFSIGAGRSLARSLY
jgi:hypothetical protein